MQTRGVEERDALQQRLFVQFHHLGDDGSSSQSTQTSYMGKGIWQDDSYPCKGERWMATLHFHGGRVKAETPVVTWTED